METGSTTYHVDEIRFVPTTGKVKAKNPDRIGTVYGTFRHVDEKGQPKGDALTITQKVIDRDTAANPVFAIDLESRTLTLPSGERGRKAVAGIEQDAIDAMLAAARGESDEEADEESDESAESDDSDESESE